MAIKTPTSQDTAEDGQTGLPEEQIVIVLEDRQGVFRIASPRLARREQAADFEVEVTEEREDDSLTARPSEPVD